ncbi:MAG TPA: type II secretion system protein [Bdellovibrionales bacterium]|jgi:prepilin-type N-terminal cleavage/methylation domain-containing protein|nr:type II secretion system protein [Bdellovibrionales bacterium]
MLSSIRKSQSGMTLIELSITLGLVGGLILIVGTLLSTMNRQSEGLQEAMAFSEDLERLQLFFEKPFRTATDLQNRGGADLDGEALTASGVGQIRSYDSTGLTSDGGANLLAIFYRENSVLNGATSLNSSFTPTAVYFQRPTPTTYGMLYVMSGTPGGSASLVPSQSGVTYGKITHLKITLPSDLRPKSISVEVALRYPTGSRIGGGTNVDNIVWCPQNQINDGTCTATDRNFKNIVRTFIVDLKNNADPAPAGDIFDDFFFGRLYFLR